MAESKKMSWRRTGEQYFEWRGHDVSRIEALSDAVFAITMTLLIVTDGRKIERLDHLVTQEWGINIVSFGITFTLLALIWNGHYLFFRRYDLRDLHCRILNYVLLFVVLCYAFPLKLMFDFLVRLLWLWEDAYENPEWREIARSGSEFMTVYSLGFALVYGIFFLLYRHAWKYREELELSATERHITRATQRDHILVLAFTAASVIIAQWSWPLAGVIYLPMCILLGIFGWRNVVGLNRLVKG